MDVHQTLQHDREMSSDINETNSKSVIGKDHQDKEPVNELLFSWEKGKKYRNTSSVLKDQLCLCNHYCCLLNSYGCFP